MAATTKDSAKSALTPAIGSVFVKMVGSAKVVTFTWNKTALIARTMMEVCWHILVMQTYFSLPGSCFCFGRLRDFFNLLFRRAD